MPFEIQVILYGILFLVVVGVLAIFIRAFSFKPKIIETKKADIKEVDEEKIVDNFSNMLKIKTTTQLDPKTADYSELEKFQALLKSQYPLVHKKAELEVVDNIGLLYKISGASTNNPTVLMSHYDVVTVSKERWQTDPFTPTVKEGRIFARGAIDNKATLLCIMESLEDILKDNPDFVPKNDLYLTFGGDEENTGACQQKIVKLLHQRGVKAGLVLDEGGAIVSNIFPGVKKEIAVVGLSEKGIANIELYVNSGGGHASTPSKDNPINILAKSLVKLEQNPMKFEFVKPVLGMLDTLGRHSTFAMKCIFANMWLFAPLVKKIFSKGIETRAMLTTTFAYTTISGSKSHNVLPSEARVNLNIRIANNHSLKEVIDHINKVIDDKRVGIEIKVSTEPSPIADLDGYAFSLVKSVMANIYPEVIVSPYIMLAASDSRFYSPISDGVLKFAPFRLSKEQRGSVHGDDENIEISSLVKGVQFYTELMKRV